MFFSHVLKFFRFYVKIDRGIFFHKWWFQRRQSDIIQRLFIYQGNTEICEAIEKSAVRYNLHNKLNLVYVNYSRRDDCALLLSSLFSTMHCESGDRNRNWSSHASVCLYVRLFVCLVVCASVGGLSVCYATPVTTQSIIPVNYASSSSTWAQPSYSSHFNLALRFLHQDYPDRSFSNF